MPGDLSAEELQELATLNKEKLPYLEKIFTIAETLYYDLCLRFFKFPIDCREDVARNLTLVAAILGDTINPQPTLIGSLGDFRGFRDQIEDLIRRRQVVKARNLYRTAAQALSDMQKNVLQLRRDVIEAENRYRATHVSNLFPDHDLPVLNDDMTVAPGYEAKLTDIRAWVGVLPEAVKGIEMGMKIVDSELKDILGRGPREDRQAEFLELAGFTVPDSGDDSDETSADNSVEIGENVDEQQMQAQVENEEDDNGEIDETAFDP